MNKALLTRITLIFLPVSMILGGMLAWLQSGNWLDGSFAYSGLSFAGLLSLSIATRWASGSRVLQWIVLLTFGLRLGGGVVLYNILPMDGYDDPDDRAGFVYTDAHRRDLQAWELASSEHSILDAFRRKYYTDQYGGLLGLSALIYRYLSPGVHRPILLILLTSLTAALGLPFLWKAINQFFGVKTALAAGWIFALYPESILLGGAAMREPYLMTLGAVSLWGFVNWQMNRKWPGWVSLSLGLVGMLLISPVAALMTIILLAGWFLFSKQERPISIWPAAGVTVVFALGLILLASALNREGNSTIPSPFGILGEFFRGAVNWDVYQLERGSGWVQKLFDEMPEWLHLPFVIGYGLFQPVLPAAFVEPTTVTWRIIAILRALGWYILLPMLILSFVASFSIENRGLRNVWLWIATFSWLWILLAALRGGGDQWDNPRYRAILFLWQALLAGNVWVWWRATRSAWFIRIFSMEVIFLIFFGQWYASRYYQLGGRMEFGQMVGSILAVWGIMLTGSFLWDRHRLTGKSESL